jgi:CheY-like chemotaxis protein
MLDYKPISYDTANFLIVDDDIVSIKSIQRAMKKLNICNPVKIARDGIEAIETLNASVDDAHGLPPFIVTLDLSMPRMDGHAFLEEIRKNERFKKLVVFVLTSSDAQNDIARAYEKNIAGYIVKEDPVNSLKRALTMLDGYANLVILPK